MDDDFRSWIGRTETVRDPLPVIQAQAVQAMLDSDAPQAAAGDALPLAWQWFHFLPRAPQSGLGDDGHPQRGGGGFYPPIPYPRRMFAGSRMMQLAPLVIGEPAERIGTIRDVVHKTGKSGSLAFVTVAYQFMQRGAVCIEEEQDIVFREPGPSAATGRSEGADAPPRGAASASERGGSVLPAPVAATLPPLPEGAWSDSFEPDSRLLFRFSALTFNAHRIHYDRPYAMAEEGYPGLVVHGPLTAVMLLELVRKHTPRAVVAFSFKGMAPLFDGGSVRLVATPAGDQVELQAQGPDGRVALAATATLGPQASSRTSSQSPRASKG